MRASIGSRHGSAAALLMSACCLASCGGGNSGSSYLSDLLFVAEFLDAPVENLAYQDSPSGLTGMTDVDGAFKFKSGDTVTFTAAGLAVGSVTPAIAADGTGVITPLSLTGETSAADAPKALAIARALNTLTEIAVADGDAQSGVLVMPTASSDAQYAALSTQLAAAGAAAQLSAAQLQSILDSVYGSGSYTVVSDAVAQTALDDAVGDVALTATFWQGASSSASGGANVYLYFLPNQTVAGVSDVGDIISGTWSLNSDGSYAVTAQSSQAGDPSGAVAATVGTSSTTFSFSGTNEQGQPLTGTANEVQSSNSQYSNVYTGAWFLTATPTAAGIAAGDAAASAVILVDPNGRLYGAVSTGDTTSGSIDLNAGTYSGSISGSGTLALDFAALSGTFSNGSTVLYTIGLSR